MTEGNELQKIDAFGLEEHTHYIGRYGQDMPDIQNWRWGRAAGDAPRESRSKTAADF